jgi:hypothetical protein
MTKNLYALGAKGILLVWAQHAAPQFEEFCK